MKKLKKLFVLVMCAAAVFTVCKIDSFAAGGQLRFSDPSTTVGANVDVTAKLSADDSLGSVSASLTYDSQYLRFVGGNGAVDSGGTIQLTGDGGGNSEVDWTLQFQALAEGSTQITISSVSAKSSDGGDVSVTQGNSTVTIGPGDPSLITQTDQPAAGSGGGGNIEIDGQTYTVSTEIPDILIPEGFVKADMTYGGQVYAATRQEKGSIYAIYLANAEGEEDFFLFDPEAEAFSKFEQISVSEGRYIILLNEDKSAELPDYLQKTSMSVNGKEFPAWQNIDASSYYVLYALNADGEKGYYQYDTVDGTYQRYTPESTKKSVNDDDKKSGLLNKLRTHLDKVILVAWGIFLVMLIAIIVLAVKLRHRNLELDDLYDEYGIDLEDEEEEEEVYSDKKSKKKAEKDEKKKKKKSEDDFYDFEDEDALYDDEDDYEDDELNEDSYREYDASEFEDDSEIEDLDAMLNARVRVKKPAKRPKAAAPKERPKKQVGHAEDDDTFKMDLIDLD